MEEPRDLTPEEWQDQNGNDRYSTEVVLQAFNGTLVFFGGQAESRREDADPNAPLHPTRAPETGRSNGTHERRYDDEIPF